MNNITINELLSVAPLNKFEILFGWKGKDNYFSKIIDSTCSETTVSNSVLVISNDFLSGKQLLAFIEMAIEKSASALIFTGKQPPNIPEKFSSKFEAINIAVIYVPDSLTIKQIKEAFELVKSLKNINQFYNYVACSTHDIRFVGNDGIQELIEKIEIRLQQSVFVIDPYFQTFYFRDKHSVNNLDEKLSNFKKSYYTNNYEQIDEFKKVTTQVANDVYFLKLQNNHQQYGYIVIEQKSEEVTTFDLVHVKRLVPFIITQLINRLEVEQVEKKYQKNFIYDLLHNNFDSQYEIINQASVWGWDFTVPHQLLLVDIYNDQGDGIEQEFFDHMELVIRNTMSALFYKPLTVELNGKYLIIYPETTSKDFKERKKDVKKLAHLIKVNVSDLNPNFVIRIGIGRYYPSIMDLCRSFQEAKTALELCMLKVDKSQITHFEDLGVVRLLASIRQEQLDDYCQECIGELIQYDKVNETDMVNTLQIYLNENGNLKSTADKLFIHTNTLRNRLKRIENVLQIDLQNNNDLLDLLVTLKIYTMNTIRN